MNETIASTRAVVYKDQSGQITEVKVICPYGNSETPAFLEERILPGKEAKSSGHIEPLMMFMGISHLLVLIRPLPALV